jgi:beta-galactosidase
VVTIEVQDQKGRVVPDACPMLNLRLEGDARILGVGNGDPMYAGADHPQELNCKAFSVPAFNGVAQVLVQSTTQKTTATLTCESDGLKNGTVIIDTK